MIVITQWVHFLDRGAVLENEMFVLFFWVMLIISSLQYLEKRFSGIVRAIGSVLFLIQTVLLSLFPEGINQLWFISCFENQLDTVLENIYILLTECEGRTGRISARGLGSTDRAASARSVQKRPRADILPVRPERTRSIRYLLRDF